MKLVTFDDLGYLALTLVQQQPFIGKTEWVGRRLGDLDRTLRRGRRRLVERNLRLFDPELGGEELESLVCEVFRDRWANQGDSCYRAWARSVAGSRHQGPTVPRVEGGDRLRRALGRGKGVILWESPFGSRTRLHLTLLNDSIPFIQVHGAEHGGSASWLGQKLIRGIRRKVEAAVVPEMVDIQEGAYSYLRVIKARLAANLVVCMPGLGPKGRSFVRLNLLGRKEYFATGVVSLAMSAGASLIPVFSFEEGPGNWKTIFEEPIAVDSGQDRRSAQAASIQRYARTIESYVRRYPEQWRRWHTDPLVVGKPGLPAVKVDLPPQRGSEVP